MIIYHLSLPNEKDSKAFVKFMHEVYFPAVHKGPTRVGQVTDLILLKAEPEIEHDTTGSDFFWHVGWDGLPVGHALVDDEKVQRKFDAFKPQLKRIGFYREVAVWRAHDAAAVNGLKASR